MHIRRERASDAQPVGSGLLLHKRPGLLRVLLAFFEILVQLRPLDPGFNFNFAVDAIKLDDASETVHVDERRVRAELLSAHRVFAARNADRSAFRPGCTNGRLHSVSRFGSYDPMNSRRIEVRVHVVDADAPSVGVRQSAWPAARKNSCCNAGFGSQLKKITSG